MRSIQGILFLLFTLLVSAPAGAQMFYTSTEYGISLGGSQYFGDLNENYGFKFVRPSGGAFVRYQLNPYISIKGCLNFTHVGYSDSYSDDPYNRLRNLSFESNVYEGVFQAEFNFFRFSTGEDGSRFTPYLTGGIGAFYYNPYTYYGGNKYYLRSLGTEGQNAGLGTKYSSFAMCIPIGIGVKYWVIPGYNIGFEIADRLTTTDYLDDVSSVYAGADKFSSDPRNPNPASFLQDRSIEINPNSPLGRAGKQRGNSSTKDQYLMFMINMSFQLKTYRCPSYKARENDYPRF